MAALMTKEGKTAMNMQAGRQVSLPSTEANGRDSTEMVVVPGSVLYDQWLELLKTGQITYAEFLDWTTPDDRRTRLVRFVDFLRDVVGGLRGISWRRGI